MNIHFPFTDQVLILEKLGYKVSYEIEFTQEGHYPVTYAKEYGIYNVYKDGIDVREPWMDRLSGKEVVEYVFDSEIRKKIISLF